MKGIIHHHFVPSTPGCCSLLRTLRNRPEIWIHRDPIRVSISSRSCCPQALFSSSSSILLAVKSPASSGDYSVFIPISMGFLFLYWISNFVVPGLIYKDLQTKAKGRDENDSTINREKIGSPGNSKSSKDKSS